MSWERHYNPTEEAMEKYKPWKFDDKFYKDETAEKVKKAEIELLVYCMEDHSKDYTPSVIEQLKFYLIYINSVVEDNTKSYIYKTWRENNKLEFYSDSIQYDNADDFIKDNLEDLVLLCKVVKTDDYFRQDSNFYEKVRDLREKIEYFTNSFHDIFIQKVEEDLKEFYEDPYTELKEELTN